MRKIRDGFAWKGFAVALSFAVLAVAAQAQQPSGSNPARVQPARTTGGVQPASAVSGKYIYVVKPQSTRASAELLDGDHQPIGFTGYIKDVESGLYYAKARYYDPRVGRFTTQDPVAGSPVQPPSLHRYLYAYANPTVYTDPSGRCANPVCAWSMGYTYAQDDEQRASVTKAALNTNAAVGRTAGALYEGGQLVAGPAAAIVDVSDAAGGDIDAQARWGQRLDSLDRYGTRIEQAQESYGQYGPMVQLGIDFAEGVVEHFAQWKTAGERQDWFGQGRAGTRLGLDAATVASVAGSARGILGRTALAEGSTTAPMVIVEGANGDVAAVNFRRELDNDLSEGFSRGGYASNDKYADGTPTNADPPTSPSAYSVAYETRLNQSDFGRSREVHYNRAAKSLDQDLNASADYAQMMESLIPGVGKSAECRWT